MKLLIILVSLAVGATAVVKTVDMMHAATEVMSSALEPRR
jgi:hypothetical protein